MITSNGWQITDNGSDIIAASNGSIIIYTHPDANAAELLSLTKSLDNLDFDVYRDDAHPNPNWLNENEDLFNVPAA